ncbi:hypothetical protein X925_07375 [Petrotoga sp. 9T1HF07.CasAA.8.2]|nr:hypothetical protein X925_07375 [Petrotoga sp. 9T1HF07.CasAA.8.2]
MPSQGKGRGFESHQLHHIELAASPSAPKFPKFFSLLSKKLLITLKYIGECKICQL